MAELSGIRAMIMAAGLGTRLRPLTDSTPKALVPFAGKPMLHYSLDLLQAAGIREFLINVHHFADQMIAYAEEEASRRGIAIHIQEERELLLGPGGGVSQASDWLFAKASSALIWNPDGLVFPPMEAFWRAHKTSHEKNGTLCTLNLVPSKEVGKRYTAILLQNDLLRDFCVQGTWQREANAELSIDSHLHWHFAGGYFLQKEAAAMLPQKGTAGGVFHEMWKPLALSDRLAGFRGDDTYQDLGEVEDLRIAEERWQRGDFQSHLPKR